MQNASIDNTHIFPPEQNRSFLNGRVFPVLRQRRGICKGPKPAPSRIVSNAKYLKDERKLSQKCARHVVISVENVRIFTVKFPTKEQNKS